MSKIPSFESLRAKEIGRGPVFFKTAQDAQGLQLGQGMGGVTTGRPDEMQAPESADEVQFENDFSSLAFQFVQDRAPALMPYMIGFEVVDRSESGSKAVGIYGYKIDDDFYYIPVFFLNNQIRGVDMVLNKKTNSFVPLTEDWVDYIVNRHSVTLGKSVSGNLSSTFEQPDLEFLREPKNQSLPKKAEAEDEIWSFKTAWAVMREQTVKMAEADGLMKEMFNGVLRAVKGAPVEKKAEATYIRGFLRTVGGPEAQVSLLKSFQNVKFANAALSFYKDLAAFDEENVKEASVHKDIMAKKAAAVPKLRVVTAESVELDVKDETSLTEEDAKQVLTRGFTITDKRPAETTADMTDNVLTVDFEKRFSTPTEVGKYAFVMQDGKLREGYLLSLTHSSGDNEKTLVYFTDDKVIGRVKAEDLIVDTGSGTNAKGDSVKNLFDEAEDKGEIVPSPNNNDKDSYSYLFVGPDGRTFGPVKIKSVFKDGDDISFLTDYCSSYDYMITTESTNKPTDFGNWDISDRFHDKDGYKTGDKGKGCLYEPACCDSPCSSGNIIGFCEGIDKPSVTNDNVLLPDSWKVLKVTNVDPYPKYIENEKPEDRDRREQECKKLRLEYRQKYTFGSTSCILAALGEQGTVRVKIASTGPDTFHLKVDGFNQTSGLTYKEAALTLVSRFGGKPKDVFRTLDKAASAGSVRVLIARKPLAKEAQVGVSMPTPIPPEPSVDDYTGIPVYGDPYIDVQNGQFTNVPALPPEGGLTRGIATGSEIQNGMGGQEGPEDSMLPIDQQAQMLADQAAQAGQRHVFDQAAVGGLSKVYDTSAVVDSYIPNFMDSIDRLGRILFLFYWKHEDFNSRYGSDDVVEMEDRLRSVFKQLGDLTLKLKEKAVRED